jgi:hypothetical protein
MQERWGYQRDFSVKNYVLGTYLFACFGFKAMLRLVVLTLDSLQKLCLYRLPVARTGLSTKGLSVAVISVSPVSLARHIGAYPYWCLPEM